MQFAAVPRLLRERSVALVVHVPGVGTEEAIVRQRRRIGFEILLCDDIAVARQVRPRPAAKPAAVLAYRRREGGLSHAVGVAFAKQRLHDPADVLLEVLVRLLEILGIEILVVPLAHRKLGLGIDLAIDQRQPFLQREAPDVGHAKARHTHHLFGMMRGHVPDDRAAPVVPDPDGPVTSQAVEELEHVGDDVLERVILVPRVDAGPAVAAHVGRDRPKTEVGETRQLVTPAD